VCILKVSLYTHLYAFPISPSVTQLKILFSRFAQRFKCTLYKLIPRELIRKLNVAHHVHKHACISYLRALQCACQYFFSKHNFVFKQFRCVQQMMLYLLPGKHSLYSV